MTPVTVLRTRFAVDDAVLSALHAAAFGLPGDELPWAERLARRLHVDYEPHLDAFYREACGFTPTAAGLLSLT